MVGAAEGADVEGEGDASFAGLIELIEARAAAEAHGARELVAEWLRRRHPGHSTQPRGTVCGWTR